MGKIRQRETYNNAILTPIYQNTAFFYDDTETYKKALHEGTLIKGRYGRYHNPNWVVLEDVLAKLDHTEASVIFPSGMSAIYSTLMALADSTSRIATTRYLYKNSRRIFDDIQRFGIATLVLDNANEQHFMQALAQNSDNIDILFLEIPSNPHLYMADIQVIKALLSPQTLFIVDSTFASPYNLQPYQWGADLVIHSGTKYLNGHADLIIGSVAGDRETIDIIRDYRNMTGAIVNAQDAFTFNQHLKTFPLRMSALNTAGEQLAQFLDAHPMVSNVYYLGLETHPHHRLAKKYNMPGYGGVVTFELKLSQTDTAAWIDQLKIPYIASNFGSAETYIEHLAPFTYYYLSAQERASLNITDSLIRLSIGYNDPIDELINDLDTHLNGICNQP